MLDMVRQMGIAALVSIVVAAVPAFVAAGYAVWPSERKLALMRPISLASIFAGIGGVTLGVVVTLRGIAERGVSITSTAAVMGLAESLVPMLIACQSLTAAWLLVVVGMRRQS